MFDSAIQLQPGEDGAKGASAERNRIINGQFDIWQRDISFSGTTGPNGDFTADRWNVGGDDDGGARTMNVNRASFAGDQQEVPSSPQFYARIQTFSDGGSGSEAGTFVQRIETGPHLFNGQKATASFWARSNTSGPHTIAVGLRQIFGTGGSSAIAFGGQEITLTDTWTFYSLTFDVLSIAGKTVIFGGAQPPSLRLRFLTQVGASVTGSNGVTNPLDFRDELWLTNVQFESGDEASAFEDRFVADELALCQRFYQKTSSQPDTPPLTAESGNLGIGRAGSFTTTAYSTVGFPVVMRVTPTATIETIITAGLGLEVVGITDNGITMAKSTSNERLHIWSWTADAEME